MMLNLHLPDVDFVQKLFSEQKLLNKNIKYKQKYSLFYIQNSHIKIWHYTYTGIFLENTYE